MKIYGIDVSFPTNKVRYVANALGLSYQFVHLMPFSPEANAPDYRADMQSRDWYQVNRSFGQQLIAQLLAS